MTQSFRSSVWALLVNKKKEFLLVQLNNAQPNEFDFVKWWMEDWETFEETLAREIKEELWEDFEFKILEKSNWRFVYDWPEEIQKERWFLWQVRTNYWVLALNEKINIPKKELKSYKLIKDTNMKDTLIWTWFPNEEYLKFEKEWKEIQDKYKSLFN